MSPHDEELVRKCQRELPYVTTAFEELLARYEPLVFRTCRQYLGNAEEAEEATQDVFIRVLRAVERFEGRAKFRTWLFRIVANVCATRFARLRRDAARRGPLLGDPAAPTATDPEPSADVALALRTLTGDDREILLLRHVAGLAFDELAEALDIGLSAAKMRLYRAEERLRVVIESQPEPP